MKIKENKYRVVFNKSRKRRKKLKRRNERNQVIVIEITENTFSEEESRETKRIDAKTKKELGVKVSR